MTLTPLSPTDNRPLSGKALQTAVEALKYAINWHRGDAWRGCGDTVKEAGWKQQNDILSGALAALEQAAIQQQPEPVAWMHQHVMKASNGIVESWLSFDANEEPDLKTEPGTSLVVRTPLYAAAPALQQPEPIGTVCLTAPERIWLQIGDEVDADGDPIYCGDEATWCADKINDSDTMYVRADKLPALQQKEEPSGWKLVPVDMTAEMARSYCKAVGYHPDVEGYTALLAASPSPAEKPAEPAFVDWEGRPYDEKGEPLFSEKPAEGERK